MGHGVGTNDPSKESKWRSAKSEKSKEINKNETKSKLLIKNELQQIYNSTQNHSMFIAKVNY